MENIPPETETKLHPIFTQMNGKNSTTPLDKKPHINGTAKDSDSSSDDDIPITSVRRSGTAPSSTVAKKLAKKVTTPKLKVPTKKNEKKQAKTSPKKTKNGKTEPKPKKKSNKQTNLSEFLTPGSSKSDDATSKSPKLTYEERMEQRAKNINKQVIKSIVGMDIAGLNKILEAAARGFPNTFVEKMPNEFVRYCYNKALVKYEQKGKDATERAKIRQDNKDLQAVNEFSYLHRKLFAGKFEDAWIADSQPLPDFPLIECDRELLFKCIRLSAFLQSYRQILEIRKNPTLFQLMDAFDNGEDGFWKVTGPILSTIVDFIRKHQRTIPHFTYSGYLNYNIRHITPKTVHLVARKILNSDYNPNAALEEEDEGSSTRDTSSRPDSPMEVENGNGNVKENGEKHEDESIEDEDEEDGEFDNKQSKEDDDLCERFCYHQIYELTPLQQARILELLIERVELSGPVRNSMRNTDLEVKKLKENIAAKQKKMEKINKDLEDLPPMIAEEDYAMYSRAMTISIVKKNQQRKEIEEKKEELEEEISRIQDSIEEMRGCSRFRASPLGFDRFYRRYWFLPPTAGLFVEQGAWTTEIPDESQPLALPRKPKFHSYEISDDNLVKHLHTLLNGGYPSTSAPVKWYHINSIDLLDKLIQSLNTSGIREAHLKDAIQKSRPVIESSFKLLK